MTFHVQNLQIKPQQAESNEWKTYNSATKTLSKLQSIMLISAMSKGLE